MKGFVRKDQRLSLCARAAARAEAARHRAPGRGLLAGGGARVRTGGSAAARAAQRAGLGRVGPGGGRAADGAENSFGYCGG